MSKQPKWQSIPSWLIIVLCCSAGAVPLLLIYLAGVLSEGPVLSALPPLPAAGMTLYGIDTPWFHAADPYLQSAEGEIYALIGEQGDYAWQATTAPPAFVKDVAPCSPRIVRWFERTTAPVVDCRVIETMGEWCMGPRVAFAITEEGEVWRRVKPSSCSNLFLIFMVLFIVAGFIVGILLVGIRKILIAWLRSGKR